MTRIPFVFDIVETDAQLEKLMLLEIAKELNARIPGALPRIDRRVRDATFAFLQNNDTYRSLVSGELAAEFGIPSAGRKQRIDRIIRAVADRMQIEFRPLRLRGGRYSGGLSFRVLMIDLSEVLTLVEGLVVTEKGQVLEWLKWLLTFGDSVIVSEYDVLLRPGKGRSGGGLMIADDAGAWRVPPQFSGTLRSNWLTRAFRINIRQYLSIIEKILDQELSRI